MKYKALKADHILRSLQKQFASARFVVKYDVLEIEFDKRSNHEQKRCNLYSNQPFVSTVRKNWI